jgi:hypothetical protein
MDDNINLVSEPHHPLGAEPKLELAEQGCTCASWPILPFSDKEACSSPDFLPKTLDALSKKQEYSIKVQAKVTEEN